MAEALLQKISAQPGVQGVLVSLDGAVQRSTFDEEFTDRVSALGPEFVDKFAAELAAQDVLGGPVQAVTIRSDRREIAIIPDGKVCAFSFRNVDPVFE